MTETQPAVPTLISSRQVLFRIVFRLFPLVVFARIVGQDFGAALAALLMMSAIFCVLVALMRREPIFGSVLTHWDEAATFAVLGHLVAAFG
jgi:hypothetical protein